MQTRTQSTALAPPTAHPNNQISPSTTPVTPPPNLAPNPSTFHYSLFRILYSLPLENFVVPMITFEPFAQIAPYIGPSHLPTAHRPRSMFYVLCFVFYVLPGGSEGCLRVSRGGSRGGPRDVTGASEGPPR